MIHDQTADRVEEAPHPSPRHLADLAQSGITPETAAANRVCTITDARQLVQCLGWDREPKDLGPALAFPYYGPTGKFTKYVRLKFDSPRTDRQTGKPIKYEAPRGSTNHLYFPAACRAGLTDSSAPLVVVEGEKKGLCLSQYGYVVAAVSGVWSWCKKGDRDGGPKELIDDFAHVALTGRVVYVVFDSDAATNSRVTWARWYLAEALKATGADVRVVLIPDGADEDNPTAERPKVGADDFVVAHGPDAFRVLVDAAAAPVRPNAEDRYESTDMGVARRFAVYAREYVRYVADRQAWFVYDGKRWARDSGLVLVVARAKAMLRKWTAAARDRAIAAVKAVATANTKDEKSAAEKEKEAADGELGFALKCQDARVIRRFIELARSEWPLLVTCYRETFDTDPAVVNCQNGTMDLRTGTLRPHDRTDYLTRILSVAYDPNAAAPLYHRALNTIFTDRADLVAYVRTLSGVCLTGDVSSQTLHIFHGSGANGKSLLLELWLYVLGEYAGKLSDQVLVNDDNKSRHPTEKAVLAGLRLAVASETGQGGKLDEARVKELTGSDTITARKMREDFFEIQPSHKLILATNHKPRVTGTDHAIWRRVRLVPFDVKFWTPADAKTTPGDRRDPRHRADPMLPERLRAEAAGVLADMVAQAVAFYQSGRDLTPPDVVTVATSEYRTAEDTIGMFFAERVEPDHQTDKSPKDRHQVKAAELYKAYKMWAEDSSMKPGGSRTFGEYAKQHLDHTKSNTVIYFAKVVIEKAEAPSQPPNNDQKPGEWESGSHFPYEHETQKRTPSRGDTGSASHPPKAPADDPGNGPVTFTNSERGAA
jgi:putative DNA primase/helicase